MDGRVELEARVARLERAVSELLAAQGRSFSVPAEGGGAPDGGGLTFRSDASSADPGLTPEVQAHMAEGRTIQAIKVYRDVTGAGLKEAKEAVEALRRD